MRECFLSFFYVGYAPKAPGTFGSLAAAIPAFFILVFLQKETLFLLAILLFLVSLRIIDNYEKEHNKHDAQFIVIDEVVGVFVATAICGDTVIAFILSLLFFRIFDITKPSIIGRVDKGLKGGLGVMLDDLLAGLFAGASSHIVMALYLKLNYWDILLKELVQKL